MLRTRCFSIIVWTLPVVALLAGGFGMWAVASRTDSSGAVGDHSEADELAALAARGAKLEERDPATLNVEERVILEDYLIQEDCRESHPEWLKRAWWDSLSPQERKRQQLAGILESLERYPWAAKVVSNADWGAEIYEKLGQPERAEELRRKGLAIGEAIVKENATARWRALPCYGLVGLLAGLREPTPEDAVHAREYCAIGLASAEEHWWFITRARFYVPLAELHVKVKEWDQAEDYARKALERGKELIGNLRPRTSLALGRALAAKGKKAEAIQTLQELIDECPDQYEDIWRAAQEEVRRLGSVPHEKKTQTREAQAGARQGDSASAGPGCRCGCGSQKPEEKACAKECCAEEDQPAAKEEKQHKPQE